MLCPVAQAQTIFSENFDNCTSSYFPIDWVTYGDGNTNHTSYLSYNDSWQVVDMGNSNKSAFSVSWIASGVCDRWMVTPQIVIPATGNYSLTFNASGYSNNYPEQLRIMVSPGNASPSDFSELADYSIGQGSRFYYIPLTAYAGQTIRLAFVNHSTNSYHVIVDDIEVSIVPTNSIALLSTFSYSYAAIGAANPIGLIVKNTGSDTLRSFQCSYSVNNGSPATASFSGLNIAPFAIDTFYIPYTHSIAESVTFNLAVSQPNGAADSDTTDNSGSCSYTVYNPAMATPRTVLLETFGTSRDIYTPGGVERINSVLEGIEDSIVWVTHHVGFYEDSMTADASQVLLTLFGRNGTWAPGVMIDRDSIYAVGQDGIVTGGIENEAIISRKIRNALSTPAYASIAINNLTYDSTTRQLNFSVSGQFYSTLTLHSPRLTVYLTEDSLVMPQNSTGSVITNYIHNHALRACLSNDWGDSDPFTSTAADSTYSKTYTYTLPTNYNAGHCKIVAFLNDFDATSIFHRQVLNATQAQVPAAIENPTPTPPQPNNYTVTVLSSDSTLGTVTGSGTYTEGSTATLTVYPQGGTLFNGWSNGSNENPLVITVTSDTTLIAYLSTASSIHDTVTLTDTVTIYDTISIHDTIIIHDTIYIHDTITGIESIQALDVKIYSTAGQVVVEGAMNQTVRLYDAVGHLLATRRDDFGLLQFDVPASGAYLIQVANLPARRIIVAK